MKHRYKSCIHVAVSLFTRALYYGPLNLMGIFFEKSWIDRHRFRIGLKRPTPTFTDEQFNYTAEEKAGNIVKRLRVCLLTHFFYPEKFGGTERFVANLARGLKSTGYEVTVITFGRMAQAHYNCFTPGMLWREYFFEGIDVLELRYKRMPTGFYYKRITNNDVLMYGAAVRILESLRPDIVHCAYPQPYAAFLQCCQDKGCPYILTLTDFSMICHYATLVDKTGQFCTGPRGGARCARVCRTYGISDYSARYSTAEALMRNASALAAPSAFVANVFAGEFAGLEINIIPHGISEVFYPSAREVNGYRFVYAGTLSALKGVHMLVAAFRCLEASDAELDIYGSGGGQYLRLLHRLAGSDKRIHFRGAVVAEEMPQIYRTANCVVVPSMWFETYNFVLREAIACGCKVIAARLGAMPEAIREGENGYLFEPGDKASLLEALNNALADNSAPAPTQQPKLLEECEAYSKLYHRALIEK